MLQCLILYYYITRFIYDVLLVNIYNMHFSGEKNMHYFGMFKNLLLRKRLYEVDIIINI